MHAGSSPLYRLVLTYPWLALAIGVALLSGLALLAFAGSLSGNGLDPSPETILVGPFRWLPGPEV
jgi:hypothetical protein